MHVHGSPAPSGGGEVMTRTESPRYRPDESQLRGSTPRKVRRMAHRRDRQETRRALRADSRPASVANAAIATGIAERAPWPVWEFGY